MVSIIVLNFNGKRFLKGCIESVLGQTYTDFELILFDNNSTDDSIEFANRIFKDERVKLVCSGKNLGFAGGNNEALKHTKNDLIVLLNNDTVVNENWLKCLFEAMNEKNTVASSFVKTEGINKKYYETNGSVSYMMYNVMNIFENIEDEFYPNGCSLIFRKSEISEPFDSDYFYYSEDLYLGLKARFMGMKVKFVKDSVVRHFGGGSSGDTYKRTFYQSRNQLLNLYTFFSAKFIFKIIPLIAIARTAISLRAIFLSEHSFWGMQKAPFWIILNLKTVREKARRNREFKKLPEEEIIKCMTSKLVNDEGAFNKLINRISYAYSRMVGIKPIEYYQKNPEK